MKNIHLKFMNGDIISIDVPEEESTTLFKNRVYDIVNKTLDVVCQEQIKIIPYKESDDNNNNDNTFLLLIESIFNIDYVNAWRVSQFYKIHGKKMSDRENNIVWVNRNGLGQYELYKWLEKEMSISFHSKEDIKKVYEKEEMTSIARDRIYHFLF